MADFDLSRKRAQQEDKQFLPAEEPARNNLDTIPVQIWTGPADGTLDYCNDQWRAYTGLRLEQIQGHGWQRILHPEDKDRVLKAWQEAVTNGTPYDHDLLADLPPGVDPCGENGEFHSFVFDGPNLAGCIDYKTGERTSRDNGFCFCDLLPGANYRQ